MVSRKHLIGISLAALAAGMAQPALAQGIQYSGINLVNTSGTGNVVTPTDTGTGNSSYIYIRGNDNTASSNQSGNNNASTILQPDPLVNTGTVNNNWASHRQESDSNQAETDQNSSSNSSTIRQHGANPTAGDLAANNGINNYARVTQSGGATAGLADRANIEQEGQFFSATVVQSGAASDVFYYGGGTCPDAACATTVNGSGNSIDVVQSGARSLAALSQWDFTSYTATPAADSFGDETDNAIILRQTGVDTFASIIQGGQSNIANVTLAGLGDPNTRCANTACARGGGAGTGETDIIQLGAGNSTSLNQSGDDAFSRVYQGNLLDTRQPSIVFGIQGSADNEAGVTQGANADHASTDAYQAGASNIATVNQDSANASSALRQVGVSNGVSVTQSSASGQFSLVMQGQNANQDVTFTPGAPNVLNGTNNNSATVTQTGTNVQSRVYQAGNSDAAGAGYLPGGRNASLQASGNVANVIQQGTSNSSTLTQASRGNNARVAQRGGSGAAPNLSTIDQSDENSTGLDTAASNVVSNNSAIAAMEGLGNRSTISQNGRNNRAEATLSAGGASGQTAAPADLAGIGVEPAAGDVTAAQSRLVGTPFEANRSRITQRGTGLTALVVANADRQPTRGKGNQTIITQGTSTGAPYVANNHVAAVWLRGVLEATSITQRNGAATPTYTTAAETRNFVGSEADFGVAGNIARAVANVSTNGNETSVLIDQTGDNYAAVTIGGGNDPANNIFDSFNTTIVRQVDAGDGPNTASNPGDPNNPFDNQSGTTQRDYNDARLVQQGDLEYARVQQNAMGAVATVFQQNVGAVRSSRNSIYINQGMGTSGSAVSNTFGTARDDLASGGPRFLPGTGGAGTLDVTANVEQSGLRNDAVVNQDGGVLIANVVQRGTGSSANGDTPFAPGSLHNLVVVSQTGANNIANATQYVGVGPSACGATPATGCPQSGNTAAQNVASGQPNAPDEFFFAGGASRSAEIRILQANTGNRATATQAGLGQWARIEQFGQNNQGRIDQGVSSTNATAVLRQFGNSNTYYISQTSAPSGGMAQYAVVTQTGNNNSGLTIDSAGPPSNLTTIIP